MLIQFPFCQVITDDDSCFNVDEKHYEQLKDMLDRKEKGWIELESAWDNDARIMTKVEKIEHIIYVTEAHERARAASVTNA